jgi:intracellular sulfur oxidation DsrE/DsrF family protein
MKKIAQVFFIVLWSVIFAQLGFSAETYSNGNALTGGKEIKAYFDVNIAESAKLLIQLQIIETTYSQLVALGYSPRFVVGVRGKASNFFTREDDYVLDNDIPSKKQIASRVEQFKAQGFRMEQCRIAADMQGIAVTDFLFPLVVVDNGYISMIVYQSQGYSLVPIY